MMQTHNPAKMSNEKRVELLKKFIEEEPDDPFNYYALALEYAESDPESAISIFRKLIVQHKEYLPTYYKLAHLLCDTNQIEEANKLFEAGIALAEKQGDLKALAELRAAFQNFQFDID